jgi:uncharacterized protein with HEPN domain
MLDCIRRIEAATADGRAAFLDSDLAQDAVARNLQTLTESSKRLSSEVKTERPEIEWARMAAFRNVIVHDYLGLDVERIWDVITRDLPSLRAALRASEFLGPAASPRWPTASTAWKNSMCTPARS